MKLDFDLNLLRILEALMLEESVSGAAGRLGITQSAVSHALRRLREHFGDSLFIRSGHKMLRTPRAQSLEPYVQQTMDELRRQLSGSAKFDPTTSACTFTINTTDVGEAVITPSIVSALRRLAPGCKVRFLSLSPSETVVGLEQGEVDLSIGPYKFASDNLYQQLLLEQELLCIVSRSHYGDIKAFESREHFASLPHVAIRPFRREDDLYEWAFAKAGVRRHFACDIHSLLAAPYLVLQSDVVATVPNCLPREFYSLPGLVTLPLPFEAPRMQIWQIWHRRFHADATNQWLRQNIHSIF